MYAQQIQTITNKLREEIKLEDMVLPGPPVILKQICALQNDPLQNAEDVVELMKDHPLVRERLIRLANSAKFRTRVEITSVKAAILRLGISRVLSLLSGMCIGQYLASARHTGLEKYFNEMWFQGLDVASIAFVLAEIKTDVDSEKALLAGMIHNIGVLPLLLSLHSTPAFQKSPGIIWDVAAEIIPKYYPYAGRILMQSWGLPSDIVSIATSHRNNQRPVHEGIDLCDLIQIAFALNKVADYTDSEHEPTDLVESLPFQKFWRNWEEASTEMKNLHASIKSVRQIIAI